MGQLTEMTSRILVDLQKRARVSEHFRVERHRVLSKEGRGS